MQRQNYKVENLMPGIVSYRPMYRLYVCHRYHPIIGLIMKVGKCVGVNLEGWGLRHFPRFWEGVVESP